MGLMIKNRELEAAFDALRVATAHLQKGELLTWAEIERVSGFPQDSSHYRSVKRKLSKFLREERGIAVETIVTVGWHLMTDEEQVTKAPKSRRRRAARQLKWGSQEVKGAELHKLPIPLRKIKLMQEEHLEKELHEIRSGHTITRKSYTSPRRGPAAVAP